MKRNFKVFAVAAILGVSVLFSSCIGSFGLFNKVLTWNKSVGDKWVNELVFLACNIVPVYSIAIFVDMVVLNSIEFWTGSNPVADVKVQQIEGKDGLYTVETSKDGHKITKEETGEIVYFNFNEAEKLWSVEANGEEAPLMKVVNDQEVVMFLPDGSEMQVSLNQAGVLAFRQVVMDNIYFAAK